MHCRLAALLCPSFLDHPLGTIWNPHCWGISRIRGWEAHHDCFPDLTVSWSLKTSLHLKGEKKRKEKQFGPSVYQKERGCKVFVKTIWCSYWSMWAEHMDAPRESLPYFVTGADKELFPNLYSSQHGVWSTLTHVTDESLELSRGHHLLHLYSINRVVWEKLQVHVRGRETQK